MKNLQDFPQAVYKTTMFNSGFDCSGNRLSKIWIPGFFLADGGCRAMSWIDNQIIRQCLQDRNAFLHFLPAARWQVCPADRSLEQDISCESRIANDINRAAPCMPRKRQGFDHEAANLVFPLMDRKRAGCTGQVSAERRGTIQVSAGEKGKLEGIHIDIYMEFFQQRIQASNMIKMGMGQQHCFQRCMVPVQDMFQVLEPVTGIDQQGFSVLDDDITIRLDWSKRYTDDFHVDLLR